MMVLESGPPSFLKDVLYGVFGVIILKDWSLNPNVCIRKLNVLVVKAVLRYVRMEYLPLHQTVSKQMSQNVSFVSNVLMYVLPLL